MIQFYIPWEGKGGGYDENLKLKHRTGLKAKMIIQD
jgi:hypothetical protein